MKATLLGSTLALSLISAQIAAAQSVTVINSFSDPTLTQGAEMTFMQIEAPTETPLELAMYTITVSENQITFELVDNSAASDLVFPEGRQDIWYISVEGATSYSLSDDSDANFNPSETAVDAGSTLQFDGAFRDGLLLEYPLDDAGIRVALGGGTDLNEIGTSWVIDFE